jgi:hypothetical protein
VILPSRKVLLWRAFLLTWLSAIDLKDNHGLPGMNGNFWSFLEVQNEACERLVLLHFHRSLYSWER